MLQFRLCREMIISVTFLPQQGKKKKTARFIHTKQKITTIYYVADDRLTQSTDKTRLFSDTVFARARKKTRENTRDTLFSCTQD